MDGIDFAPAQEHAPNGHREAPPPRRGRPPGSGRKTLSPVPGLTLTVDPTQARFLAAELEQLADGIEHPDRELTLVEQTALEFRVQLLRATAAQLRAPAAE